MKSKDQNNVFNKKLEICSEFPLTGYFRDGCCNSSKSDAGQHIVCAVMSKKFLEFSLSKGNDLISPRPEFNFPGLKAGDKWCICIDRWLEAFENSVAPKIILAATNKSVLDKVNMEILKRFALDIN